MGKPPELFDGKSKRELADEAFKVHGKNTSKREVDAHFRKHGIKKGCEVSMYYGAKRAALGLGHYKEPLPGLQPKDEKTPAPPKKESVKTMRQQSRLQQKPLQDNPIKTAAQAAATLTEAAETIANAVPSTKKSVTLNIENLMIVKRLQGQIGEAIMQELVKVVGEMGWEEFHKTYDNFKKLTAKS